jgi:hypothetical protein
MRTEDKGTTMRWMLAGLFFVVLLPLSPKEAAAGSDEEAKEHFLRGKQLFLEGKNADAIQAFKAAAALRPSPILDFNIGRCHDKLGRFREAISAYERYLSGRKDAPNRAEVQARIGELKRAMKKQRPPKDPYEELEAAPASAPASRPSPMAAPAPAGEKPGAVRPAPPARSQANPGATTRADGEGPPHEASLAQSWTDSGQSGTGQPAVKQPGAAEPGQQPYPPAQRPPPRNEGPFYKQWWFWVACAGGALITGFIIATAVGGSGSHQPSAQVGGLRISF